jgi:hypothetical protein
MDDLMSPGGRASLIERIKAILLKPKETWPVIAGEAATPRDLITRYALPLIVLSALAGFIGMQLFGLTFMGITIRPGLMGGLTTTLLQIVLGVVAVVVVALVAEWLAPKFGGTADRTQSFKLIVYSMTAGWVGGLLAIYPPIAMLGALAGLYGLYLLYLGATTLMKVPEDKAVGFTAVTVICAAVAIWVSSLVVGMVTGGAMLAGGMAASPGEVSGELKIPGVGSVDMGKLEAATKQMEAAANGSGASAPVAPSAMQALLPTAIGGWQRTSLESASVGNFGGTASGTYSSGDKKFELRIVDMSALGALAGLGSAMGVQQNREDADGYERTGTVDGAMQNEEWNRTRSRGKFGRMIGGRFMIEAEGDAGSIDDLKAAVAAVDAGKLAGMVK